MKTHSGQEIVSKDAAAAMKAPFTADVKEMKTKFVQLAAVFADNKMAWRPSERVRSVAEVLLLMSLQVMDSCGKLSASKKPPRNDPILLGTDGSACAANSLDTARPIRYERSPLFSQSRSGGPIVRFVDLFARLGGFHVALEDLGDECVFASEIGPSFGLCTRRTFLPPSGYGDAVSEWRTIRSRQSLAN